MAIVSQQNLIVDGSFEFGVSPFWSDWYSSKPTNAWASDGGAPLETWGNGYNAQSTPYGRNFIELDNGLGYDSYSQTVDTAAGQHYTWSVSSMLRAGVLPYTAGVELVWNGAVVKTFTPTDWHNWNDYSVDVVGTGNHDVLTIREVAGQSDGLGALIDNVTLYAVASDPLPAPTPAPAPAPAPSTVPAPADQAVYHDVAGTQWLDGKTANDIFVIDAKHTDYQAGRTQDGLGIVVWSGDKFDILTGFDTLRFTDGDIKADAKGDFVIPFAASPVTPDPVVADPVAPAPVVVTPETTYINTSANQYLTGTTANDVFVINGNTADYNVVTADDGKGVVVRFGDQLDVLNGFDVLRFNDRDVKADAKGQFDIHGVLNAKGEMIHTNTAGTQWMEGFSANDVYVVGGKSSDFQVGKCADKWGVIVWQGNDFDILYDVEVIRFDDKDILSSTVV